MLILSPVGSELYFFFVAWPRFFRILISHLSLANAVTLSGKPMYDSLSFCQFFQGSGIDYLSFILLPQWWYRTDVSLLSRVVHHVVNPDTEVDSYLPYQKYPASAVQIGKGWK